MSNEFPVRKSRRSVRKRRGTSLIEFALVVPVLLAMLIGIMEFGWLVRSQLLVANATREGARSAAIGKRTNEIRTRIKNAAGPLQLHDDHIKLRWSANDGNDGYPISVGNSGSQNDAPADTLIQITTTIPHDSLTDMFVFLNNRDISVSVVMRREATSSTS